MLLTKITQNTTAAQKARNAGSRSTYLQELSAELEHPLVVSDVDLIVAAGAGDNKRRGEIKTKTASTRRGGITACALVGTKNIETNTKRVPCLL